MSKRKPETQSGFASFSMHELAEAICGIDYTTKQDQDDKERMDVDEQIKPKQNERQ
jgi:hypothetical protein